MSGDPWNGTRTQVEGMAHVEGTDERQRMTWQEVIDKLNDWQRDPDGLAEDDLIPPTEAALLRANFVVQLGAMFGSVEPPKRVVPDGNGGVDIEFHKGSLEIDKNGRTERVLVKGGKVVSRETIYE